MPTDGRTYNRTLVLNAWNNFVCVFVRSAAEMSKPLLVTRYMNCSCLLQLTLNEYLQENLTLKFIKIL